MFPRQFRFLLWFIFLLFLVIGCRQVTGTSVSVEQAPLIESSACNGRFIPHDLPHETATAVGRVGFYISNGAGLAVNDLDNDGDMDLVLANLYGPSHIFWNERDWQFRQEELFDGSVRAVTTVDVDGDGWLDIVLSRRNGRVGYWRNTRAENENTVPAFVKDRLDGVESYVYSMTWGDLDADGDLDLITASYDASLEKQSGAAFKESGWAGVFVHENEAGQFTPTRLNEAAQALTLGLVDVDQDGRRDILVGNDFDVPDYVWLARGDGWETADPFDVTTFSTMSLDSGDINNDGRWEFFAADMHPYSGDRDMMLQWLPAMAEMDHNVPADDPQYMENVLQVMNQKGEYENIAKDNRIEATGWSWSSKFGDLDQDGYLDLYSVNGMAALEIFSHLPNDELIEENQAFRNDGQGNFEPRANWGLNSTYGGRGMSMGDMDNDGDLDIIINNLRAPAQIFENQLCQGASLLVDLRWPESNNTHSLGAKLTLNTNNGIYVRDVRAASGYLSGDPSRIHFGFPQDSELHSLEIIWPDGANSVIQDLEKNHLLIVERD